MAIKINTPDITEESRQVHPFEILCIPERVSLDIYKSLKPHQLLLMNFPKNITKKMLENKIKELNKEVFIQNLQFKYSLKKQEVAYALVSFSSEKEAKNMKSLLKDVWFDHLLLKVKTKDDRISEDFDNRTVIANGIPSEYRKDELLEIFSPLGAVVGIELPMKNTTVEEQIKLSGETDFFTKQKKDKQEQEFRKAQVDIQQRLNTEREYVEYLENLIGKEKTYGMMQSYKNLNIDQGSIDNVLEHERYKNLNSMITQLQLEVSQVQQNTDQIQILKQKLKQEEKTPLGLSEIENQSDNIEESKDKLIQTIKYLDKNRDSLNNEQVQKLSQLIAGPETQQDQARINSKDALQQLQELSRKELASAYDLLLNLLNQRSDLIKDRIKDSLNFIPVEDRIHFEQKLYKQEIEDIQDATTAFELRKPFVIEEIMSVNEQIANTKISKENKVEDRYYGLVAGQWNPFIQHESFDAQSISRVSAPVFNGQPDIRDQVVPGMDINPSVAREMYSSRPFYKKAYKTIKEKVKQLKEDFETPFDELYHKEKGLIQEVILAEKLLREKEKSLPHPLGKMTLNINDILARSEAMQENIDSDLETEHQFVRDKRKEHERILKSSLNEDKSDFEVLKMQNKWEKIREEGKITEKDYNMMKTMEKQNVLINHGYAFITYSHADEAKKAIVAFNDLRVDTIPIKVTLKSVQDHGDQDYQYSLNKARNDAKLIDELDDLRNKRKNLRDFEENMDKDIPRMKRLREFKETVKDFADNRENLAGTSYIPKTLRDEERTKERMREFQKQHPNVDITQLFETEKIEKVRQNQHKKAYVSYKAFEFLKNGVEFTRKTQKRKLEEEANSDNAKLQKKYEQMKDPYNFPPLEQTVGRLLTKEKYPYILDAGDRIDKPGRKFTFTEKDFIESYLGKDGARMQNVEIGGNIKDDFSPAFGFNDTLKSKYPIDKFMQAPGLDELRKKIHEKANPFGKDMLEQDLIHDGQALQEWALQDEQHPSDPNRSYYTDLNERGERYFQSRDKTADQTWDTRDVINIEKQLNEEYYPKEIKKTRGSRGSRSRAEVDAPKEEPALVEDVKTTEKFEPFYDGDGKAEGFEDNQVHESAEKLTQTGHKTYTQPGDPNQTMKENLRADQKQKDTDYREKKLAKFRNVTSNRKRATDYQMKETQEKVELEQEAGYATGQDIINTNNEYLYDLKFRKEKNLSIQNYLKIRKYQQIAKENNITLEELYQNLKHEGNITNEELLLIGQFAEQNKSGFDKYKMSSIKKRERSSFEDLDQFADEQSKVKFQQLLEEQKNMKQLAQQKIDQAKENRKRRKLRQNLDNQLAETPDIESFFASEAQGKHHLDQERYQYQENLDEKEKQNREEDRFDQELIQRELQGRLMGEKLSPRQFALLYKVQGEGTENLHYIKNKQRETYITERDRIRLIEEQIESYRRKMVIEKKWTEEQSQLKIKELINQISKEQLNPQEMKKKKQEHDQFMENIKILDTPEKLYEQEYHFDEGLGQSLNEHVEEVKKMHPDLIVQTRRDRDGFAIVKTVLKPKYKYDIEKLMNFDFENGQTKLKETMELILKDHFKSLGKPLEEFDSKDFEETIAKYQEFKVESSYKLDAESEKKLKELVQDRFVGKYANDNEGFLAKYKEIMKNKKVDQNNVQPNHFFSNFENFNKMQNQTYEDILKERKQMSLEIYQQMTKRMKEYIFLKERKDTDFVKPKLSEKLIFDDQLRSQTNRMGQIQAEQAKILKSNQEEELQGYSKEHYQQLKRELQERKEAKARLIQQGYADFKPFMVV